MNITHLVKLIVLPFLLLFTSFLVADMVSLDEIYYPTVCYNDRKFNDNTSYYKMWFQTSQGRIGLAYSDNGTDWNQQALNGLPNEAARPFVVYDPAGFGQQSIYYKMWYWDTSAPLDSIAAIKLSTSPDGINWTVPQAIQQDSSSPLVTGLSSGYFYHLYSPGFIMYNPNVQPIAGQPYTFPYVMFFESATEGSGPGSSQRQIGLAYSNDGITWIRYGTAPIIIPSGNSNDWNGLYVYYPLVYKLKDSYEMFYVGSNSPPDMAPTSTANLGVGQLTSEDGIQWTPVIHPPNALNSIIWQLARKFAPLKNFNNR